jgi:REP element-mobilizing transposase RayT
MRHRRRLPHVYRPGAPLFLTWHLRGSIPSNLKPPGSLITPGEAFVWLARRLDTACAGPKHLLRPEIATAVRDSIRKGVELSHYALHAWVIMPNHVHLLINPLVHPSHVLQSIKGATARECNRLLGRTGEPFWQKESYDHWVRTEDELRRIRNYIESNPVKAGLTQKPDDWPWSSASVEKSLDAARTSACATNSSASTAGPSPRE